MGVGSALEKFRPGDPLPTGTEARIEAARNEFESFQIVIGGGSGGVSGVSASASALAGPGGAEIAASEIMLYAVRYYTVTTPSNLDGSTGRWPDPLVPDVDAYANQKRNAFPFDVPANESRVIWVEAFVPPQTPAGIYTGVVTLSGSGLTQTAVNVTLRVRNFELPSTSSLKTAFGLDWDDTCVGHFGSYEACGEDQGIERYNTLYTRAMLDHRISIEQVVYAADPPGFTHFDAVYGPLLDGTANTRLSGAALTTLRVPSDSADAMNAFRAHFDARGWGATLFHYTCDEPPNGCGFQEIPGRAAPAIAAGIPSLVTMDLDQARDNDLLDHVNILVPVVNYMHDRNQASVRDSYEDGFLALATQAFPRELWWYISCMSHGCDRADDDDPIPQQYYRGWPAYVIDTRAVQNRAMPWLAYKYRISGELFYASADHLEDAWDDGGQYHFTGNADGAFFYPGTPDRIGGSEHIPIESVRLKVMRDGLEDYEYLKLADSLGDSAAARAEVAQLLPEPSAARDTNPADVLDARSRLAGRIEELLGVSSDDAGPGAGGDAGSDAGSGGSGSAAGSGGRDDASAAGSGGRDSASAAGRGGQRNAAAADGDGGVASGRRADDGDDSDGAGGKLKSGGCVAASMRPSSGGAGLLGVLAVVLVLLRRRRARHSAA